MSANRCPEHGSVPESGTGQTVHRPLDTDDYHRAARPAVFGLLAEQGPIHRVVLPGEVPAWLITSRAEAEAALRDPRLTKDPLEVAQHGHAIGHRRIPEDFTAVCGRQLMNLDGADHTRIRQVISGFLSESALRRRQPVIEELTGHRIAALAEQGTADLVAEFAVPLVTGVMSRISGVSGALTDTIMTHGALLFGPDDPTLPTMVRAYQLVTEAAAQAIREGSSANGADDLAGGLARAVRDGVLTRREASSTLAMVLIAATGGPVRMLSHAVVSLHDDGRRRAALVSGDPLEVVEDLLYEQAPIPFTSWRFATAPMEIAGRRVREGDAVMVLIATANTTPVDPVRGAGKLPVQRRRNLGELRARRNLAFGAGRHRCLGESLARRIAATALTSLFRGFPGLRLRIPSTELTWYGGFGPRGPRSVPVELRDGLQLPERNEST